MIKFLDLDAELGSLTVFRDLLSEPLIIKLRELFSCEDWDKYRLVSLYCDFVHELYRSTDSFSEWLLRYISEDENIYVKYIIEGRTPGSCIRDSLYRELETLERLSAISSREISDAIGSEFRLPQWKTDTASLGAAYEKRLEDIPKKGYGIFAKYHMFVIDEHGPIPVHHPDPQSLNDLHGYENEREKVIKNTQALLAGKGANNVLLYGDAGTGKSSTVKAIANSMKDQGLRLIEVKKNQLYLLPSLIDSLEGSPLKYIIFIDDLSFSSNDNDFAALKAILEGSVGTRGKNIAVYATSNRRHLIKEAMSDRDGDDIHLSDTMQELKSLSARFGLTVTFMQPDKELYCDIVEKLAQSSGITMDRDRLLVKAEAHAIRNGGRSPRTAKQFVEMLKYGIIE